MAAAHELYSDALLSHVRNPSNWGRLEPADFSYVDGSTVCGDEIRIDVRVNNGRVAEIAFSGRGCAVSLAAASILTGLVGGMPLDEVETLTEADLLAAVGGVSSARHSCALLSFHVLMTGLFGAGGAQDEP